MNVMNCSMNFTQESKKLHMPIPNVISFRKSVVILTIEVSTIYVKGCF